MFLPKKDEDDYLFELEKFNCSYVQRGLALVRKKLIDDSVKKIKITDFDYEVCIHT